MATVAKTFSRLASRATPFTTAVRTNAPRTALRSQILRNSSRRGYANEAGSGGNSSSSSSNTTLYTLLGLGAVGGAGYYAYSTGAFDSAAKDVAPKVFTPKPEDFQAVYNDIARRLDERDDYDDGSFGPVLVRLAWHASGTYDAATGTGGSNGATMRFAPEGDHGANAGLKAARDFLEPVKEKHPWITYSDLWTLAGVCAFQEMQGPAIPWRPGRADRDLSFCTPDGRLPDGSKGADHLRAIFGRMGWNDQEIVALSGAHALGRCHTDRSGFDGPWTFSPTVLTNDYYRLLLEEKWSYRKWNGPKQFQDAGSKSLMMLPTDMALVQDKGFRPHVEKYARDNEAFFKDFSDVICRLFELGVPFQSKPEDRMTFKTLTAQEA